MKETIKKEDFSLDSVLVEAIKKGFRDDELYKVRRAYWRGYADYERTSPKPTPGLVPMFDYLNLQKVTAYNAATAEINKTIDEWHNQADGNR